MYSPRKPFSSIYLNSKRSVAGSTQSDDNVGAVFSLTNVNNSYSRKRGAIQFNYCVDDSRIYDSSSPFAVLIPELPLKLNRILQNAECAAVSEFQCLLTSLNRVSNERVNKFYNNNSRDEGINALFVNISFLFQEMVRYQIVVQRMSEEVFQSLSSSSKSNGLFNLYSLMEYTHSQFIPSLLVRTKRILSMVMSKVCHRALSHSFKEQQHSQFLGYYSSTTNKSHDSCSCTADSTDPTAGRHEVMVTAAVRLTVDDHITTTLIEAAHQYITTLVAINLVSSGSTDSPELTRELFTVILNSSLQSLLVELIHSKQLIDEYGIYKLYRIILKYQEYIVALKKHVIGTEGLSGKGGSTRSINGGVGGPMLIQDLRIWKKAEFVLELLNKSIFARKQSTNGGSSGGSSESGSFNLMRSFRGRAPPTAVTTAVFNINTLAIHSEYISLEEQKQWIELTDNEFTRSDSTVWSWMVLKSGKTARWKHKGTVNIALSVPTSDL